MVQEHDIFLADARIVPTLPNLCGKVFFDAKKNPITVNIQKTGDALKTELEAAIKATTYTQNKGSCTAIKLGFLASHTPEQLTDNLMAALPAVLSRVKGGWENVHNLDVKTGNSAALPIWNAKLGIKTNVSPSKPLAAESTTDNKPKTQKTDQVGSPKKQVSPRKTRAAAAKAVAKAADSPQSKSKSSSNKKSSSSTTRAARKTK